MSRYTLERGESGLLNGATIIKNAFVDRKLRSRTQKRKMDTTTEKCTKSGIFDMDIFLNRLNFVFKCLWIKHSKFIGYKMQMIPILGFLLYLFNNVMLHFITYDTK